MNTGRYFICSLYLVLVSSECAPGFYGKTCQQECHCFYKPCNTLTGTCSPPGCKDGWTGKCCNQSYSSLIETFSNSTKSRHQANHDYYENLYNHGIQVPPQQHLTFSVKTSGSAYILLSKSENLTSPNYYSIGLGVHGNKDVNIAKFDYHKMAGTKSNSSSNVLDGKIFRKVHLKWKDGIIQIIVNCKVIFTWVDKSPLDIKGIGIRSSPSGQWQFDLTGRERRTYDPFCEKSCGHCKLNVLCDLMNGSCPNGCNDGWQGSKCDIPVKTTDVSSYTTSPYEQPSTELILDESTGLLSVFSSTTYTKAADFSLFKLNITNTGVGFGALICPIFDQGDNVTCYVSHDDIADTGAIWTEPDYPSGTICTAFNYTSAGFKNISAYCVDDSTFKFDTGSFYIGAEIKNVVVEDSNGNTFIPITRDGTSTVIVTYDEGSHVYINASSDGSVLYASYNGSMDLKQTFDILGSVFPGIGKYDVKVTVHNELTSISRQIVFAVDDVIEGYEGSWNFSEPNFIHVDDIVVFSITTTNGSNIVFSTEIDNTAYIEATTGYATSYEYAHTFNETGTFSIVLQASNDVSVFENRTTINVQYKVNKVSVTANEFHIFPNVNFIYAMEADALTPMSINGNLKIDILVDDVPLISQYQKPFSVPAGNDLSVQDSTILPGPHYVFATVYSESSSMNFSFPVIVEKTIQNLEFLHPTVSKISDSNSLGVRLTSNSDGPLYNVTCVFNISNGLMVFTEIFNLTDVNDNSTVGVSYPDTGINNIAVRCSNQISHQDMSGTVNVTSDCFEIGTLFSNSYKDENNPLAMLITNDNTITGKGVVTLTCRNSSREYFWELWPKLQNDSYVKDTYYSNPANQPKSATIFFGKETISEGDYRLRMVVNLTDLVQYLEDDMYVQFRLPPIVTGVDGGSTRYVNEGDDLLLNAAPKTEDKVLKYKNVPFNYTWTCRKGLSASDIDKALGEFGFSSNINTYGNPCTGIPASGESFTIPSASLTVDTWYLFKVDTEKTTITNVASIESVSYTRTAEALQAVYVQSGNAPRSEVLCKRNCLPKLSRNSLLILNADCPSCDLKSTSYEWTIYLYDTASNSFKNIDTIPSIDQLKLLETRVVAVALTAEEIGVNVDGLNEGDRVKFRVVIQTPGRTQATAEYIASVNAPPYGGSCSVSPESGKASSDWFAVTCKDWKDEGIRYQRNPANDANEVITYSVYHERNTSTNSTLTNLVSESGDTSIVSTLAVGDPNNDYRSYIKILIRDIYNGYVEEYLPVQVTNPLNTDRSTQTDAEVISNITTLINNDMKEAIDSNDPKQVLHQASVLVAAITLIPVTTETFNTTDKPLEWIIGLLDATTNGTKTYDDILNDLLKNDKDPVKIVIIQAIDNLTQIMEDTLESNASTFYMIEMASNSFANVLDDNQFVGISAGISASNALTLLINNFKNASETALTSEKLFDSSDPRLESTSDALVGLVSAVIGATLTSDFPANGLALISTNTADAREQVEFLAKVYGDQAYGLMENSDLTPEERNGLYLMRARITQAEFKDRQDLASISTTSIDLAIQVIIDQGLNMTCKGCDTTFDKSNIDIHLTKTTLQMLNEMANDLLKNGSSIEMTLVISTDSNDTTLFGMAVFPQNVYIPGSENTALITSEVHKLSLKDETEKSLTQARVAINQTAQAQYSSQTLPSYTEGDASKLFYHSFYYRDPGDYVCVSVKEEIPNFVTSYDVYVKGDVQPTHLDYDAKGEISPYNDWMICFPPQLFDDSGEMHVALHANSKVSNFPQNFVWEPSTGKYANGSYNITAPELMPYKFTIVTSACKEWDPKTQKWDQTNCKMDWFPSKGIIECTCAPQFGLTFGNTFYVAPNTIDFSTVFLRFDLANQAAVLGTLIGILVIYLLLLIWARHQDKKDIVKWGVTPLIDNFVDDTYYYLVTVYTGMRRGAGTKSRIGFIVCGEDGDTGIRELSDGVRQEIPTASVVHFLMSTPYPLGDLSYVYIWHDNSGEGESSSWYLNRVDVEDIQKRERFVFLCGKWLCLDSDDSSVDAVLPVCGKENVTTFSNMFYINTKENLADNHMWIAIFFRPTSSHYTRCQRLTCFLLFIFLTMIGNAIYFRPEDEYTNAGTDIRVGPFAFSLRAIYIAVICALISTPTTIVVIMMFKKSKPKKNVSYNIKGDSSKKYRVPVLDSWMDRLMAESRELEKALVAKGLFNTDGTILPYWFQYVAWFLALSGIGTCAFFILLFSIEWGKKKSEVWLGQFFLSFFSSTCLLDPLKVLLMSAIFAMLLKQTNRFRPTGLERSFILKNYKQRFGYETGIRLPAPPLDSSSLKKARMEREKELKMTQSIKQVILTCFCLWIIYSISYSNRDNRSYNFHQNIATKLLTPQNKTLMKFSSITRVEDYVRWLRDTAFPVLYPDHDYTGQRLHWRLRQYFHDMTSFRVGPPRLRQMRVKDSSEDIPYFGETVTNPKYTIIGEETRDFCFGWLLTKCNNEAEARSFSYAGWKFTSALDIWGIPIPGRYKTYGGGGYITELDVNFDFSNRTLNELTDHLWIDKKTRAIFLEFNLYTPDLNLFAYNNFLAEFPETGGIITMYSIYPFRIYHHLGTSGIYTLFCEVMFVVFLVALIIKVAYGLYKQKKYFFKDVWNVMDCSIISLSFVSIAMYTGRYLLAAQTMQKFKEDSKQFINFQHIAIWDFLFNLLLSTLVFMATLRLVGIMGYDKRVGQVIRVFENCARDLFWFGVFFFYVFLCYAALGYLLFGKDIESYSDIFESLGTLFISMIGKSKFTEINEKDPIMAQFYFFTFILLLVYTLLTMFLAILGESINAIHNETKRSREEELVEYLMNKFKNLFVRKSDSGGKQKKQTEVGLQNKPVGFLYDLRKGINDAFDQYSDDGKPLPPAIIDLEKRAKMVSDANKQIS